MSDNKIVLPKKWKKLNQKDQKEWIEDYINTHYKRGLKPVIQIDEIKKGAKIPLKSGGHIKVPKAVVSQKNPNLVRELEMWVGKWLVTVFHDKKMPHTKIFGISNPSSAKWIAQELSSEVLAELYSIMLKIRWKYGLFKGKRRKTRT